MPTKKNGYNAPALTDGRVQFVPIACGQCMECRKQKANEWRTRLCEEIKQHKHSYFVTLTFTDEALQELQTKYNLRECNETAKKAVRLFLERYRKEKKHSIKHWLITELGQEKTERIHLHGILFSEEEITNEQLKKWWSYGITDTGKYCSIRTINYIVKYVTKIDTKHKGYVPAICCSSGIGRTYITDTAKQKHQYRPNATREYYTLPNGHRTQLPIYYRNKLYTEEEREKLWIEKIEQDKRYINGIEIRNVNETKEGRKLYFEILKAEQERNKLLGYGDDSDEWKERKYNATLDAMKRPEN